MEYFNSLLFRVVARFNPRKGEASTGSGPAMKLSIETKVYAFFCAAFAGVVILGFVTYQSTREVIVNDSWVSHTHQVRQSLADLLRGCLKSHDFTNRSSMRLNAI